MRNLKKFEHEFNQIKKLLSSIEFKLEENRTHEP